MVTEDRQLKRIAGDLRVVGFVLALLGGFALLIATAARRGNFGAQAIGVAGVLILLLPGAWFVAAASMLGGGRGARIVAWSLRIVALQVGACVAALLATWRYTFSRSDGLLLVPVTLLVFFAPAQAALVWQLVRARNLIDARDARRGFAMADVRVAEAVALPADVDANALPLAHARDEEDGA